MYSGTCIISEGCKQIHKYPIWAGMVKLLGNFGVG